MKTVLKRMPVLMLVLMLLCGLSAKAINVTECDFFIAPRYAVITLLNGRLEINHSGKASCRANVNTQSSNYSVTLTCSLCESDGSVVKSWSTTGKGTVSLDKSWYVTSGSRYQVVATATVYDANGNYVDSGTAYSSVVSY